jgi:aerobic carbon-monoxide dehydrogenase large subunit
MSLSLPIHLTVNGVEREGSAEPRKTLADFLRDDLGLTGTHIGCEHGMCGACTVIVNGDAVRSCLMLAVQARGAEILTIEGLSPNGQLHPIQQAMHETHGFQCGFCAPGFVMSTYALLAKTPRPPETAIREALSGNLCRCTGYQSIIEGVKLAAEKMAASQPATPAPPPIGTAPQTTRHTNGRRHVSIAAHIATTHWAVKFSEPADAPTAAAVNPGAPPATATAPVAPGAPPQAGPPAPAPPLVGTPQLRVEDTRILTGRTRYINDVSLPGMLYAAFLRSPHPHATIVKIDTRRAGALPGVVAVYTSAEIRTFTNPMQLSGGPQGFKTPVYFPLAADKVRYVGDPVALVIAESRAVAEDACEAIDVTYVPLVAVSTLDQALDPTRPPVFDELGGNVLFSDSATYGDVDAVFAQADRVVKETFRQHRYAPVPIETRGGVASYDPAEDQLTYHVATQSPHATRFFVGGLINQPAHRMRVVAHDIGGSFGLKWFVYREDVAVCAVSKQLGRPVKWIEDRREHLMASGHAREETLEIEAAVKNDGTVLGLKAKITMNQGAYPALPFPSPIFPTMVGIMLPGAYRFGAMSFDTTVVASNKASYVAYRGPWEMETWARERLLDNIARELNMDPVEIRRKNIVTKAQQPTKMLTGPSLDQVTAHETLERAVALMDYQSFRTQQLQDRAQGRYRGIGFATFIEPAPGPRDGMSMGAKWGESAGLGGLGGDRAHLRIEPDGSLSIITAQMPHGQSHETTLAQAAADELSIPFESVKVLYGDTRVSPFSVIGTGGSRASTMATGAVVLAARALKTMILNVAAMILQANVADLMLANGVISVKGTPQKAMPLEQFAMMAYMAPASLPPPGVAPGLEVTLDYDGGAGGWSQSTHACIVEVNPETGVVQIERYQVVEDCGTMINPAIVEGQVRGGAAQGIGGVLLEHARYDDQGRFLTPTFHEYLMPTCVDIPMIAVDELHSQPASPFNARGVGESGNIGAPAALTNAIFDALAPLKVNIAESSMTPTRILELMGVIPVGSPPSAPPPLSSNGASTSERANGKPVSKKSTRGSKKKTATL